VNCSKCSNGDLPYEWTVTADGDPRDIILYRGPDELAARATLAAETPVNGWGATLTRRHVGPSEIMATNR